MCTCKGVSGVPEITFLFIFAISIQSATLLESDEFVCVLVVAGANVCSFVWL